MELVVSIDSVNEPWRGDVNDYVFQIEIVGVRSINFPTKSHSLSADLP